jgi:hypothetical protein
MVALTMVGECEMKFIVACLLHVEWNFDWLCL